MTEREPGFLCLTLHQGDGVTLTGGITVLVSQTFSRKVRLAIQMPKTVQATRMKKPRPAPAQSSPPTHALPRPRGTIR